MISKILIANRGEVALRVARTATDMGIPCVTVFAEDDLGAWREAGEPVALRGSGPTAYLDAARLIEIARHTDCDAVHPGYGFLSERADFAQNCEAAGLVWIGPTPEQLKLFGDKARARELATRLGIPVSPGANRAVTLDEAKAFLAAQRGAGMMIKAIGGGGGRGMRAVRRVDEVEEAYRRCVSEARNAFGSDGVFFERIVANSRHIEVQIVGDGAAVVALGERDCSLQRKFQKLVEIAPSPALSATTRAELTEAALAMARACGYRNLGTFEFLVGVDGFVFIEANPRLQVEHTVTEEVTGLDLVQLQIAIAGGADLASLGLRTPPAPRGSAIQWRVNVEASAQLTRFAPPTGPGIRVDTHATSGERVSANYDALLAKLIVRAPSFPEAARRSRRAIAEFVIEGPGVNLPLLRALAARPEFETQAIDTGFVEANFAELPLEPPRARAPESAVAIRAPIAGRIVEICVADGARIDAGETVAVVEAMKMEHVVFADHAGVARLSRVRAGDQVALGEAVLFVDDAEAGAGDGAGEVVVDLDQVRPDLARALDRLARTRDDARPAAVAKRHALKLRTARENVADLCDPNSFQEYGALAVAAQRSRRSLNDLIAKTPADAVITGIGAVNGAAFPPERTRVAVMAYDATVLAGTQGMRGHAKSDRLIEIAERNKLPMALFAEGGGGRPGDVDSAAVAGLHLTTFARFAGLSGQVPVVGIVAGRCFAGNAALLGCCDVIIATRDCNIGMGGPAMIEGGGLGKFRPEEVGPSDVQTANGVIDVLVENEAEAVAAAKTYLGFFQGALASGANADPREFRAAVPENRLRAYDMRALIRLLLDTGTMLELRPAFGRGIFTALGRIEGRPIGLLANNPMHLGGAIDADAADKGARFLQLCNVHGLPIVSLVDTPGFMVGPEIERQAQVRHVSRLFVAGAALRVPFFAIVVRKGYGLGAMAMTAGGFHSPDGIVAWPGGEFGGMGLEGAVRLGFRKELEAAPSEGAREALFRKLLAAQYEAGGALNMAMTLEIDAVIDPAESREWLLRGLAAGRLREPRRAALDTW